MNALYIIGSAVVGAGVGGFVGLWIGERQGGDYNFLPMFTGPVGALAGGFAGVVAASVVFA